MVSHVSPKRQIVRERLNEPRDIALAKNTANSQVTRTFVINLEWFRRIPIDPFDDGCQDLVIKDKLTGLPRCRALYIGLDNARIAA